MYLSPLLTAAPPIPWHAMAAIGALVLALCQFLGAKGTWTHRVVGWGFAILMTFTALSAIWISEIRLWGRFSPIHLLIPVTLISLVHGILAVRRGWIDVHRITMIWLTVAALMITGAFTFLPGRVMHQTVFGPAVVAE